MLAPATAAVGSVLLTARSAWNWAVVLRLALVTEDPDSEVVVLTEAPSLRLVLFAVPEGMEATMSMVAEAPAGKVVMVSVTVPPLALRLKEGPLTWVWET